MGDPAVFADEIFGFHVQQATEKLLKAWLASLGEAYPLSHDLHLFFMCLCDGQCRPRAPFRLPFVTLQDTISDRRAFHRLLHTGSLPST